MAIGLKTHKLLWGRSGSKCAFEKCKSDLIADETESDDESVIGDEAHIVAKSVDGARGVSSLSSLERDKYDNLILLCRKHHKVIDDQPVFYTVEKLSGMKASHEKWVKETLAPSKEHQKEELTYATYIDEIVTRMGFENWNEWTSHVFGSAQYLYYKKLKEIESVPSYIISRFWPGKYKELENAVINLKLVINDFTGVFNRHVSRDSLTLREDEDPENKVVSTEKFYALEYHEQEVYDRLSQEHDYHIDLVEDLAFEMTRAANLVIEKIRKYISPMYRDIDGKLLITRESGFRWISYKLEYTSEEKLLTYPYPGLKEFMEIRVNRDLYIGKGFSKKYLPFRFE